VSYGKNGNGGPSEFNNYPENSNTIHDYSWKEAKPKTNHALPTHACNNYQIRRTRAKVKWNNKEAKPETKNSEVNMNQCSKPKEAMLCYTLLLQDMSKKKKKNLNVH
jgi:hypothetical protein